MSYRAKDEQEGKGWPNGGGRNAPHARHPGSLVAKEELLAAIDRELAEARRAGASKREKNKLRRRKKAARKERDFRGEEHSVKAKGHHRRRRK